MPKIIAEFSAQGKKWTLQYPFTVLKKIEAHYDEPIAEITGKMAKGVRLTDLTVFIRFGLEKAHPEVTDELVDDLIDDAGLEAVIGAMNRAYGDKKGDVDPTKAAQAS